MFLAAATYSSKLLWRQQYILLRILSSFCTPTNGLKAETAPPYSPSISPSRQNATRRVRPHLFSVFTNYRRKIALTRLHRALQNLSLFHAFMAAAVHLLYMVTQKRLRFEIASTNSAIATLLLLCRRCSLFQLTVDFVGIRKNGMLHKPPPDPQMNKRKHPNVPKLKDISSHMKLVEESLLLLLLLL
jgi:hypothetical protein